jgi:ribonuclease HI
MALGESETVSVQAFRSSLEPMDRTTVFTDGAAKGNPGPGGWGAIVVTPNETVTELGGGSPHTTNTKMELSGAIAAFEAVADIPRPVSVYTDSTYLIQGITQWVWGWRKKGWRTATGGDVLNRDLWERLFALTSARKPAVIDWHWVRGHVGTAGNERCDEIAVGFALQQPPYLYRGPLDGYQIDVLTVPHETALPQRRAAAAGSSVTTKTKAYSYLSVVDGVPMRHATWAECEQRVKGRSGARYKKTTSAAEEGAILRDWGVSLKPHV